MFIFPFSKTKTFGKVFTPSMFPSRGETPSVYVKIIIISVAQGCDEFSATSSVSNSMTWGEKEDENSFGKVNFEGKEGSVWRK